MYVKLWWSPTTPSMIYFYGGEYNDFDLSDFWGFNVATRLFTWILGSNSTADVPNDGITSPGSRRGYAAFTLAAFPSKLYLLGGDGRHTYADLWEIDVTNYTFTLINGNNQPNFHGTNTGTNQQIERSRNAAYTVVDNETMAIGPYAAGSSGLTNRIVLYNRRSNKYMVSRCNALSPSG
jgi:hypothetical protein